MFPQTITIDGQAYKVNVDRNSNQEIQYFNLVDADGNIHYETDWEGPFTEADVLRLIQEEQAGENEPGDARLDERDDAHTEAQTTPHIPAVTESDIRWLGISYPQYAHYPEDFKIEAVKNLRLFEGESTAFKEVWLSEFAEDYEDGW